MKLILDTHAVIWFFHGDEHLTARARAAITDGANTKFLSAVSAMEITTKFRIGKLPEAKGLADRLQIMAREQNFLDLAITVPHAHLAGSLPIPHKDPFDRLLIAQAQIERAALVSNEAVFDGFRVLRLW